MTTLSTAQLIEAMRTVAIAADTEQGREKLNAIANRMEMLVAANAGMDLQLNSIRAALNIPINTSVQAGVIAETSRLNEEVLSLRSQLSESVALANKLRRTAKEHQEENQQLRTKLEAYDRAAKEPVAWRHRPVDDVPGNGGGGWCGDWKLSQTPVEANVSLMRTEVQSLFTAPPLPVVPDVGLEQIANRYSLTIEQAEIFIIGYDACRAAMIAAERKDGDA